MGRVLAFDRRGGRGSKARGTWKAAEQNAKAHVRIGKRWAITVGLPHVESALLFAAGVLAGLLLALAVQTVRL